MRYSLPVFLLAPSVALAHPGHDHADGFASGLTHPLLGIYHLVAMLAIGVLAALHGAGLAAGAKTSAHAAWLPRAASSAIALTGAAVIASA